MTLDLTCQACDTSFEIDVTELVDEPRIQCPSCNAKAPLNTVEGLSSGLDELLSHTAALRPKFQLLLEVDSDDLPPAYERDRAHSDLDEEEDELTASEEDEAEEDSERGAEE